MDSEGTPNFLPLTPALRESLGLGAQDALRLLSSGGRTIQLEIERSGGDLGGPGSLPRGRPLVLCADVRAFALADVLQLVHVPGKSGLLHFEHAGTEKRVYLHGGEVVFARSNQQVDRLGESLVRRGTVGREQLEAAQDAHSTAAPGTPIGRVLVEQNALTPQQLWEGVKAQVEEIVRSLFAYGAGTVLFLEGEVRPDNVVRLALPTQRLVEEGLSQRDGILEFLAFLEDPKIQLIAVPEAREHLSGIERAIVDAAESPSRFPSVCRSVGVDPLSCARTVQLLDEMGALKLARDPKPLEERDVRVPVDDELRDAVRAHAKLLAELAAPIVAVEGGEGLRERLGGVVEEAAQRHPGLLGSLELGPGGGLDPEDMVRRALCFPGDREREIRAALGELVAYLEFELVNHPAIDAAESFLRALEPLRADL
jgi:hypothetical protein